MPVYDFRCPWCDYVQERNRSLEDTSPEICEHCGCEMDKLFSAPAIVFKGAGFYSTDKTVRKAVTKEIKSSKPH